MEAVANFSANLAWIVPGCAAESIGVVQQLPSVGDVLSGKSHGKTLANGFGERERNFGVIGQMSWSIAIQETGAVGKISRRLNAIGEHGVKARAEGVALIVIEITETAAVTQLPRGSESSPPVTMPAPSAI